MFCPIALCLPFVLMKGSGLGPAWPCTQAAFFLPGCTQAISSSNQLVSPWPSLRVLRSVPLSLRCLQGCYLGWVGGKWEPPCLFRVWFLGVHLSFDALTWVGEECLESFPQAWFCVLRNNQPSSNCHFVSSCCFLPTPDAARPVSTPQLPPSDPLCLLSF